MFVFVLRHRDNMSNRSIVSIKSDQSLSLKNVSASLPCEDIGGKVSMFVISSLFLMFLL